MERTFVMIKPDAVQRRRVGEIIERFERKGLRIAAMRLMQMSRMRAERLYEVHKEQKFYKSLVDFITSGPVVVMVITGFHAIAVVRKLIGATRGFAAEPGTIRGDFGDSQSLNLIHASDSPESVARELPIFFKEKELVLWRPVTEQWVFGDGERREDPR